MLARVGVLMQTQLQNRMCKVVLRTRSLTKFKVHGIGAKQLLLGPARSLHCRQPYRSVSKHRGGTLRLRLYCPASCWPSGTAAVHRSVHLRCQLRKSES